MEKLIVTVFTCIGIFAFAAAFGLLLAFPIKWCWNYTMTAIFGLQMISWGQAWCLSFLSSCLIKATQMNTNN